MRAAWLCLVVAACYSPAERDCTVTCTAAKDCIGDQVCGTDHLCAAPGVAGHCSATDAAVAPHDAMHDSEEEDVDAPGAVFVTLTVNIGGMGRVSVGGTATCSMPMCMFQVRAGQPLVLTATETNPDKMFQMWQNDCASAGSQPTCALTPTMPTKVGAKFE
jgi:hypothetical protein